MSMVGTFDGFTAARLGIYAAQHGLRVTGNNVSNINTMGYTRQRVDQMSFKAGANDMYRSFYDNHIGSGALVTSISQLRDPYLDIRYRNASTDTYHYDTWLSGLQNIASILDEVAKGENEDGLIYRQIQDLAEKLRAYSANPTDLNDRLVRNSAESLTHLFHNSATRLEKLFNETKAEFGENINAVNEILTNIRDLNKSIRDAEIHGDAALEMRDERNRQIDALSQYLDIKVEYSFEDVGAGIQVEKLTIKLNDANPDNKVHTDESILVDGLYATQLSVPNEKPALNIFDEDSEYAYLNKFLYRREVTLDEAKRLLNADDAADAESLGLVQALDENGNPKMADDGVTPLYLVGTNDGDLDGVVYEENTNFTIQLGKLLNIKGEEWKSHTTAWMEVTDTTGLGFAKSVFEVKLNARQAGTQFGIARADGSTKIFTIVADDATDEELAKIANPVKLSEVATDADFAAFVAKELRKSGRYPEYNITASNDQIIFTAKCPGAVGVDDGAPIDWPKLAVTDEGNTGSITVSEVPDSKEDGSRPADEDTIYDEHGNVTKSVRYVMVEGRLYKVTVGTTYTHEVTLDDNDLHGILQAQREMLTEEGEFSSAADVAIDESALIKRGIPYYIKSLDLLAQKFAQAYNQLNTGYAFNQDGYYIDANGKQLTMLGADDYISATDGLTEDQLEYLLTNGYFLTNDLGQPIDENGNLILNENGEPLGYFLTNDAGEPVDKDGKVITDKNGDPVSVSTVDGLSEADRGKLIVDMEKYMKEEHGIERMGGELFTQLDGKTTTGINASNISISAGWSNGVYGLIPTFMMLFKDDGSGGLTHSTKNDNADHMVAMIENALTYNPRDLYGSDAIGPELFNGCFNDMLSNMMAVQGEDASITNVRLTTFATSLNELDYSREGVSGVDLNDEAMNMITYQKAMSAAMRVMTTIDEMLDRLINNTGIAGR